MKLVAAILIAITFTQNARATVFTEWGAPLSFQDEMIYEETLEACSKNVVYSDHLKSFLVSTGQGLFLLKESVLDSESAQAEMQQLIKQEGLSPYVADRLSSDGFLLALRTCFPDSEFKRNLYVGSLLFVDGAGRLPSAAVIYLMGKVSSKVVGGVFGYSKVAGVALVGTVTVAGSISVYQEVKKQYGIISEKVEQDIHLLGQLAELPAEVQIQKANMILEETILQLENLLQKEPDANRRAQIQEDINIIKKSLSQRKLS